MLRILAALFTALALSSTLAFAGDPVGRYSLIGSNPGNKGQYSGTITIERTGETFRVTWDIGSQTFIGTGIGSDKGFAVSYRSGNQTGLAIYGANGDIGKKFGPIPGARRSVAKPGPANRTALAQVS